MCALEKKNGDEDTHSLFTRVKITKTKERGKVLRCCFEGNSVQVSGYGLVNSAGKSIIHQNTKY